MWEKVLSSVATLFGHPLKRRYERRAEQRAERVDPYRAVVANERSILNGLDSWSFESRDQPPAEIIERRHDRPELDRGLAAIASAEVEQLGHAVQNASDRYWHAIQEHAAVRRGAGGDLGPMWQLVQDAKLEAHQTLEALDARVKRELDTL